MIKSIVTNLKELKERSEDVLDTDNYSTILEDLRDTLTAKKTGLGLCGPQIGIKKRIIYMDIAGVRKVLINPEIIHQDTKMQLKGEGCLSFPGLRVDTDRYLFIAVKFRDEKFEEKTELFQDLYSFAVQHEIDHLNGIVIINRKHKDINGRKK